MKNNNLFNWLKHFWSNFFLNALMGCNLTYLVYIYLVSYDNINVQIVLLIKKKKCRRVKKMV